YGMQGMSSPFNNPPALYEPCEWRDQNGNFWLYGGQSSGLQADLWKFNPITNEWTWMKGPGGGSVGTFGIKGIPSPTNNPPSKGHGTASWTDADNNLWLFGGNVNDGGG